MPITSHASRATHSGVVATRVTLAAMLVKLNEVIHAAKCSASEAPAATVSHAALPRIGVLRSARMVMGNTTTDAMSIRYSATTSGGPSASLTRMAAKLIATTATLNTAVRTGREGNGGSRSGPGCITQCYPGPDLTLTVDSSAYGRTAAVSDFPAQFTWGVSTSAFQIEGAVTAGGRGESIWDRFTTRRGVIADGSDASLATDHYHRLEEDLDLVAGLGVGAYRFSTSWPRLAPLGRGQYLADGWAFYDRVIDGLLARGVEPWLCLYHWDLPQALQERGGWTNRDTAFYFADHVERVTERVADRVRHVFMLNEPNVHAVLGHLLGLHAPGAADLESYLASVHHQNLATGLGVQRARAVAGAAKLGTILNLQPVVAAEQGEEHEAAAALVDAAYNRANLDPLLKGSYPEPIADLIDAYLKPGDLADIATPLDLIGVNHYTRLYVKADPNGPAGLALSAPPPGSAQTTMGWEVAPGALRQQLLQLKEEYGNPPVVVTENGAAFPDTVRPGRSRRVEDRDRASYLVAYLRELSAALAAGCDVRGYFVWTLVDNFEWSSGYGQRFGLVELDRTSLARRPKLSYEVFREIVATGRLPDA